MDCRSDNEILQHCANEDTTPLQNALDQQDRRLLKAATRNASVGAIKCLLDRKSGSFPEAEQVVLQEAAMIGNANIFRYVLHRAARPFLGEDLRYHAVVGGVPIWKELVAFNHECINWPIGHHGDAVGLAVQRRDLALVAYLLDEGADIERSHYVNVPVLNFAKQYAANQEIVDLLISRGARIKDDVFD